VLVYASLYKPYVYSVSSLYTRADWHSPGPGLRASHGGSVVISRLHRREADDLGPGKHEEKSLVHVPQRYVHFHALQVWYLAQKA
jgi:hypothetical protein